MEKREREGGYVAIMTTILISLLLLAAVAEVSVALWHAQYTATSIEKKRQANALARGCVDKAIAALVQDRSQDISIFSSWSGECEVKSTDWEDTVVTILVQAHAPSSNVGGAAYANMKAKVDFGEITDITILSVEEVPSI